MKNNFSTKKVFWIGDHAKTMFENTDKTVLNQYRNELLLYDRLKITGADSPEKKEPTYLTEFSPMINSQYDLNHLAEPIHTYLKSKLPKSPCLLIGNPGEILFQAIVDSGANFSEFENDLLQVNAFENVNKQSIKMINQKLDLTAHDLLFLKLNVAFDDIIEEAQKTKELGEIGFNTFYEVKNDQSDLNEFLWRYSNDPLSIKEIDYIKD